MLSAPCALPAEMHQFPACASRAEFYHGHSNVLSSCKVHEIPVWAGSSDSPTKQTPWLSPGITQAFSLRYKILYITQNCLPLPLISKNNSPKLPLRHLLQVQARCPKALMGHCQAAHKQMLMSSDVRFLQKLHSQDTLHIHCCMNISVFNWHHNLRRNS